MDITLIGLFAGIALLIIPLLVFRIFNTGLVRSTLWSTLRMCIQLFLIGVYLRYLFQWDSPWINLLWVVIMVLVAAQTAVQRTHLKARVLMPAIVIGFLATSLLVGLYFLVVVLRLPNPFEAQYFIPIFGIIMGNNLSVNVVALNVFYTSLYREQQQYYYLLGNGATRFEAITPFVRQAIIKSFSPCIANMAVMGIVSLPGTMTGQILGGSAPGIAIKYQMMIVLLTLVASMASLMVTLFFSTRQTFDTFDRLQRVVK